MRQHLNIGWCETASLTRGAPDVLSPPETPPPMSVKINKSKSGGSRFTFKKARFEVPFKLALYLVHTGRETLSKMGRKNSIVVAKLSTLHHQAMHHATCCIKTGPGSVCVSLLASRPVWMGPRENVPLCPPHPTWRCCAEPGSVLNCAVGWLFGLDVEAPDTQLLEARRQPHC